MSPTPDQQAAVERLYENEAIIDNMTSDVARQVLQWAEQQILAGAAPESVVGAVRAANQSGAQDAAALAQAQRALSATGDTAPAQAPVAAPRSAEPQPRTGSTAQKRPFRKRPRVHAFLKRKRS